jgi:ectoine hydroxylase-related dioxygenase (phytanoyl-CoA dioxygenase family)
MHDLYKKYCHDGYLVLRNIFTTDEIKDLRNLIDKYELSKIETRLNIDELNIKNEIYSKIIKKKKLNEIFEEIFKTSSHRETPISFFPPFEIMKNFLPKNNADTWHMDASGETKYSFCKTRLVSKKYIFGKIGIYLQRNTEWGGQIDLIPSSHKYYSRKKNLINLIQKFFFKLRLILSRNLNVKLKKMFEQKILKYKRLNVELGDVVIFDSRLLHRGTPIEKKIRDLVDDNKYKSGYVANVPFSKTKYAFYLQFGNIFSGESYWHDRSKRLTCVQERLEWESNYNSLLLENNEVDNYFLTKNFKNNIKQVIFSEKKN